nr:PREDICTED: phosphotriesterase-related protein-like [Linepithema humile]
MDDYWESETISTVTGPKPLSSLGITLTHEHIFCNFTNCFTPAPCMNPFANYQAKFSFKNLNQFNQYPYSSLYNLTLNDEDTIQNMQNELKIFKNFNGCTIVENSSSGLQFDRLLLKQISEEIKINIIFGTGYYTAKVQNTLDLETTKEDMISWMTWCLGGLPTKIPELKKYEMKAGFIGEVGSTWPIQDFERRSISATGEVQQEFHCPVSFNPGLNPSAPSEILRIYQESGGDARKAVISHVDCIFNNEEQVMEFLDLEDTYIGLSMFGTECSLYNPDMQENILSDAQRVALLSLLKEEQRLDRVLISHGIHTKNRLKCYGGHGYYHILENILPYMHAKKFTESDINMLLVENPRSWLTWHLNT